ncbi:MAG TPA: Crp/Fnr family transcriptional regulator [Dehalococcoidia bacterium]|nr:Crp/Fnr family transcriptional regulator [Dehalococcoidia bacterium]
MKRTGNLLLDSLSEDDFKSVEPYLERMSVKTMQVLVEPNEPISHVYFPVSCMISLVTLLDDGVTIESATIGNEGMSGMSVFHGLDASGSRSIVQMDGETLRMPTANLKKVLADAPTLGLALGRYADALISMLAQSGACNGLHMVEQRFARWLLTIQDRVNREEFTITQEFLGQMLGSHRPTVTLAAGVLQRAGFITYHHGHVKVLDRSSLEEVACECYDIIRDLYSRTYDFPNVPRGSQPSLSNSTA